MSHVLNVVRYSLLFPQPVFILQYNKPVNSSNLHIKIEISLILISFINVRALLNSLI